MLRSKSTRVVPFLILFVNNESHMIVFFENFPLSPIKWEDAYVTSSTQALGVTAPSDAITVYLGL